jgi:hypothetical protein
MKLLEKIRKNSKDKFNKIKKKLNIKKNYTITFDKINKEPKLFLIENKKVKLVGDFKFYGIYNKDTQIWTWSNIIPDVLLSQIKYIEELRSKAYIFEKNIDSSETNVFFYQFLINDSMIIPEKYISLVVDLLLYLTDDIYIFEPTNSINNIQFIGLSKILELHE